MDTDDLSPTEAHPWLDEPDDLAEIPTLPHIAVCSPFSDFGGQTVPAFTHDSGALVLPDDPPAHTRRALTIYAVCVLLCITGLFTMFFVLGGRFIPFPHPIATVPSHIVAGGQTGGAPTPVPSPTPRPAATPTPAPPTTPVPVIGIKPVHPIPQPPQPPTLGQPSSAPPTPPPIPDPTASAPPGAAPPLVVAPATFKLACHPSAPLTMPGTITFTIHNTSAQPLDWTIIITGGDFDISPTGGIIAPDAWQRVFINNIAGSGSLVVTSNLGDFPVTFDLC